MNSTRLVGSPIVQDWHKWCFMVDSLYTSYPSIQGRIQEEASTRLGSKKKNYPIGTWGGTGFADIPTTIIEPSLYPIYRSSWQVPDHETSWFNPLHNAIKIHRVDFISGAHLTDNSCGHPTSVVGGTSIVNPSTILSHQIIAGFTEPRARRFSDSYTATSSNTRKDYWDFSPGSRPSLKH